MTKKQEISDQLKDIAISLHLLAKDCTTVKGIAILCNMSIACSQMADSLTKDIDK